MAKAKVVKGKNFVAANEVYDKKQDKKSLKDMKTAGIAKELKLSKKEQGYSSQPKVKPQKKVSKLKK